MHKKRLRVGVLDSGVSLENKFFQGKLIKSIKLENGEEKDVDYDNEQHGSLVCSCILRENSNCEIIAIQVLDCNLKSKLTNIIDGIRYCIKEKVDIINLSLGICINEEKAKKLKEVCDEAVSKGIIIIAAHNNMGKKAYPASFDNVIGVNFDDDIVDKNFEIDYEKNNIVFPASLISLNHYGRSLLISGNSFLCPYVAGILTRYIEYYNLSTNEVDIKRKFLSFMQSLDDEYHYKIFNALESGISNKKAIFYPLNEKNNKVISCYKYLVNIEGFYNSYYEGDNDYKLDEFKDCKIYEDLDKASSECNLFVFGDLDYLAFCKNKDHISKLMNTLKNKKRDVLLRYPVISTFDRYLYSKETGCCINCQYT